jgi:hypothetical protein
MLQLFSGTSVTLHPLPIIILQAQVLANNTSSHDILLQHVLFAKEFG